MVKYSVQSLKNEETSFSPGIRMKLAASQQKTILTWYFPLAIIPFLKRWQTLIHWQSSLVIRIVEKKVTNYWLKN